VFRQVFALYQEEKKKVEKEQEKIWFFNKNVL
jgi:hypothetical protein